MKIKINKINHNNIDAVLFTNDEDETVLITCAEIETPQIIKDFYCGEDLLVASFSFWNDYLMKNPAFQKERAEDLKSEDIVWMLVELFMLDNQIRVKQMISKAIDDDSFSSYINKLLKVKE